MEILINRSGDVRCLHSDEIVLRTLGRLTISRASQVEPTSDGRWMADLAPVDGPNLGPFLTRAQALQAETTWLTLNRVMPVR